MTPIEKQHARTDEFIRIAFEQPQNKKPCCFKGCHACCSELVIASNAEVDYILEGMSDVDRATLADKVIKWLDQAAPFLDKDVVGEKGAVEYRAANIPCPLLKNGLCSVYAKRPFGCRVYFALSNPENCEGEGRKDQMYAKWPNTLYEAVGLPEGVNGHIVLEHLGLLLAERLLGVKIKSVTREEVILPLDVVEALRK